MCPTPSTFCHLYPDLSTLLLWEACGWHYSTSITSIRVLGTRWDTVKQQLPQACGSGPGTRFLAVTHVPQVLDLNPRTAVLPPSVWQSQQLEKWLNSPQSPRAELSVQVGRSYVCQLWLSRATRTQGPPKSLLLRGRGTTVWGLEGLTGASLRARGQTRDHRGGQSHTQILIHPWTKTETT